jgi:hypothetical protein
MVNYHFKGKGWKLTFQGVLQIMRSRMPMLVGAAYMSFRLSRINGYSRCGGNGRFDLLGCFAGREGGR